MQLKGAEQESLGKFLQSLKKMGASVSDLYTGPIGPVGIAQEISQQLMEMGFYQATPFLHWIDQAEKKFKEISISDGSRWTLLKGKEVNFYIHIHPSRHSPQTVRIRTSILKSTVALVAWEIFFFDNEFSELTLNRIRKDYLGLSPVKKDQMKHILSFAGNLKDRCEEL